jgi:hypothetical protein
LVVESPWAYALWLPLAAAALAGTPVMPCPAVVQLAVLSSDWSLTASAMGGQCTSDRAASCACSEQASSDCCRSSAACRPSSCKC